MAKDLFWQAVNI